MSARGQELTSDSPDDATSERWRINRPARGFTGHTPGSHVSLIPSAMSVPGDERLGFVEAGTFVSGDAGCRPRR